MTISAPHRERSKPEAPPSMTTVTDTADFEIETRDEGAVVFYTPNTYAAIDWARKHLANCVMWGRSYMMPSKRGNSLRGHLAHKEGFTIAVGA